MRLIFCVRRKSGASLSDESWCRTLLYLGVALFPDIETECRQPEGKSLTFRTSRLPLISHDSADYAHIRACNSPSQMMADGSARFGRACRADSLPSESRAMVYLPLRGGRTLRNAVRPSWIEDDRSTGCWLAEAQSKRAS